MVEVSGPISVAGSMGLPSLIDFASGTKRARNASAILSCKSKREPATQAWPWLWKMAKAEPFTAAVNGSAFAIFHNQGQACVAGSRLLLQEKIAEAFLARFLPLAKSIRLGNPIEPATEMGPLTSTLHRDRVLSYVQVAKDQGGEVLLGGKPPERPELSRGCYVEPTVVRARPADRVCQEEVFGPFVTVTTFRDDDEALAIANGTEYGLGGGLWTANIQRAHRFAREMKSGMVWINCYKRVNPASPFGGTGSSGYGREMGFEVMREYTQTKSVWVNVDAQIPPYYPRQD